MVSDGNAMLCLIVEEIVVEVEGVGMAAVFTTPLGDVTALWMIPGVATVSVEAAWEDIITSIFWNYKKTLFAHNV